MSLAPRNHHPPPPPITTYPTTQVEAVKKSDLQLVGVTAMFIASKLEEIYPPRCAEFALTTDGAYDAEQIYEMEHKILEALEWMLIPVTCNAWAKYIFDALYWAEQGVEHHRHGGSVPARFGGAGKEGYDVSSPTRGGPARTSGAAELVGTPPILVDTAHSPS